MARWLANQGFARLSILEGGLKGWREAGFPVGTLRIDAAAANDDPAEPAVVSSDLLSFVPSLTDRYLLDGGLPARRRLATLFVDIAGSTLLLSHHSPETVLAVVQRFMRLVTEVALAYCGDVKDFEGDGALLYFESTLEATQAALAIRDALGRGRCSREIQISARMSLTVGDVVLGVVGSTMRQAVSLVGPSVSVGARLLRQIEPGGIIATGEVVEDLRAEAPELAAQFVPREATFEVPGTDGMVVSTYVIS